MVETLEVYLMVTFHGIELISSEDLFRPTTISEHCAENVDFLNKSILDLGCGIGPLAIYFALNGAKEVAACDIHPEHVKLTQKNAEKNNVVVDAFQSDLFSTVNKQYDVVCCDVSGVESNIARITGWFPSEVPTADETGSNLIVRVITDAPSHLNDNGSLYVCGTSFSNTAEIEETFKRVFPDAWDLVHEVDVPFSKRLNGCVDTLPGNYFVKKGSDYFWQFKLYKATRPAV